jgi:hypothetical protein
MTAHRIAVAVFATGLLAMSLLGLLMSLKGSLVLKRKWILIGAAILVSGIAVPAKAAVNALTTAIGLTTLAMSHADLWLLTFYFVKMKCIGSAALVKAVNAAMIRM